MLSIYYSKKTIKTHRLLTGTYGSNLTINTFHWLHADLFAFTSAIQGGKGEAYRGFSILTLSVEKSQPSFHFSSVTLFSGLQREILDVTVWRR